MRERPLHADRHVFCEAACIHIPAVAVEPEGLLCPSSDPALQDVETPGMLGRAYWPCPAPAHLEAFKALFHDRRAVGLPPNCVRAPCLFRVRSLVQPKGSSTRLAAPIALDVYHFLQPRHL
jgi:hypothetical protein